MSDEHEFTIKIRCAKVFGSWRIQASSNNQHGPFAVNSEALAGQDAVSVLRDNADLVSELVAEAVANELTPRFADGDTEYPD